MGKRKSFKIYLKSGQVIPVKAEKLEIEWSKSTGECTYWSFKNMSTRVAMPVWIKPDEIVAVTQKGM